MHESINSQAKSGSKKTIDKLKGVLFILVLGSVSTLALLGIRSYTYPKIAHYKNMVFKTTILDSANLEYTLDNFQEVFDKSIRKVEKNGIVYYLSPSKFYIFKFEGRGLWGKITGIITLRPDLVTVERIMIISQEETPGLGARIAEDAFLNKFNKKKFLPKLDLVLRRKADKVNEVDAISGATMTSAAFIKILNESVKKMRENK